jgi:ubiquinone/menaquinone biosynthesis C-methylase UbiE
VIEEPTPTRELWDEVWETSTLTRYTHRVMLDSIARLLPLKGAKVLEIGCGSGVDAVYLAQHGARVVAADYSMSALKHARSTSETHQTTLPLVAADLFHLPYPDDTFDLVFSQGLMEHFHEPLPGLLEQVRVLHGGGLLCVDVPQTYSLYTVHKHRQMRQGKWFAGWETSFSLPELESLIRAAGLEVASSYGYQYFPATLLGIRNLHTLDERKRLPLWFHPNIKKGIEGAWCWLEKQRWYYRWLACVGVIGRKPLAPNTDK